MLIVKCPLCQEMVRAPANLQAEMQTQCPWCKEELDTEALLEQLPPALIVLNEDALVGAEVTVAHDAAIGVWANDSGEAGEAAAVAAGDGFDGLDLADKGAADGPSISSMRSQRPQKNAFLEFIKIAGGAMLAVPIAQLILWWLPGEWQRDPLKLGPKVGAYVPWIVPANFRGGLDETVAAGDEGESESRMSAADRQQARNQQVGASGKSAGKLDQAFEQAKQKGKEREQRAKDLQARFAADRKKRQEQKNANQLANKTGDNGPTDAATDGDDNNNPKSGTQPNTTNPRSGVGVVNARDYTLPELAAAIERVESTQAAWANFADGALTSDAKNQLAGQLFDDLSELGSAVTYVNPEGGSIDPLVKRLQELLNQLAEQPDKLALLGNLATAKLNQAKPESLGIFIFGTVNQISPQAQLFETTVDMASRERKSVKVISRADPNRVYGPKSRIIILGSIVPDPAKNLAGFMGEDPMVVMGGFPMQVAEQP